MIENLRVWRIQLKGGSYKIVACTAEDATKEARDLCEGNTDLISINAGEIVDGITNEVYAMNERLDLCIKMLGHIFRETGLSYVDGKSSLLIFFDKDLINMADEIYRGKK